MQTAVFQMDLSVSVFELAQLFQNIKCVSTQGLSNPTKKFGIGLKTASVEDIKCKIRFLEMRPY